MTVMDNLSEAFVKWWQSYCSAKCLATNAEFLGATYALANSRDKDWELLGQQLWVLPAKVIWFEIFLHWATQFQQ